MAISFNMLVGLSVLVGAVFAIIAPFLCLVGPANHVMASLNAFYDFGCHAISIAAAYNLLSHMSGNTR